MKRTQKKRKNKRVASKIATVFMVLFFLILSTIVMTIIGLFIFPTPEAEPEPLPEFVLIVEPAPEPGAESEPEPEPSPEIWLVVQRPTEPLPDPTIIANYMEDMGGQLELPVVGATGWAAVSLPLRSEPSADAQTLYELNPSDGFTILGERDAWWSVMLPGGLAGWVDHRYCFINLPDVVPSIVYNISNSYSSLKRSSGIDIPNVSGEALYDSFGFNERLNREEFIVPTLYATSFRIAQAQQLALAEGNTLVVYEVFRPYDTQRRVVTNLQSLVNTNETVAAAFTGAWSLGHFIATGISHHQRGAAVDLSLARIVERETESTGNFSFTRVTEYVEYDMPSAMHELSPLAIIFTSPTASTNIGWRNVPLANSATDGVRLLMQYMGDVGFTPIASEWWHFNDLPSVAAARDVGINGRFFIDSAYSVAPMVWY